MEFASLKEVENRLNKNYECIKELEELIYLQNTEEDKLELIAFIGKMYAEYVTGIYSSNILEQQIVEIGRKLSFTSSEEPILDHILIVMTECAAVGGHSVLVHNWIKWDTEKQYSIVFTKKEGFCVPEFIKSSVQDSGGKINYLSGSYIEKAIELLKISQKFEKILLFTHMEDIVPILAYSNNHWKTPVYFYNHADFRFSFGFSVSDIVMNLCKYDEEKTIRYRGIPEKNSIYFQFPGQGQFEKNRKKLNKEDIQKIVRQKYGIKENEKLIVSMGDDFKYENIIGYEFDAYVEEVLKQSSSDSVFLIIGADKEKEKWIDLNERTKGKGRALGILSRNEAEQLISVANLYIVSFPMEAQGRIDAECNGIPYLLLNVIGRNIDKDDIRVANSVEELIEKTLDILNGNEDKYLLKKNIEVWTKQEWTERWEEICSSITDHELHMFRPQRHIEKQEYINCQLMQEKAAQRVYDYINVHYQEKEVKKELIKLDRKYDMGIFYYHMLCLEKKCANLLEQSCGYSQLSDKHLQLYLTAVKWIELKQKGKRIDEYLFKQGCRTVAIYGMSYMGECLANELSNGLIKVVYGIDKNSEKLHSKIPVFYPSDTLRRVDAILNTTMVENSEILKGININGVKMIRLKELIDEN